MIAAETIAQEIADAILAETEPGASPTSELMLRAFTDAYELIGLSPSEGQHQDIADRVFAKISLATGNGPPASDGGAGCTRSRPDANL